MEKKVSFLRGEYERTENDTYLCRWHGVFHLRMLRLVEVRKIAYQTICSGNSYRVSSGLRHLWECGCSVENNSKCEEAFYLYQDRVSEDWGFPH